eukprot:6878178-Alexandrium_andersonii.AAC.1
MLLRLRSEECPRAGLVGSSGWQMRAPWRKAGARAGSELKASEYEEVENSLAKGLGSSSGSSKGEKPNKKDEAAADPGIE